MPASVQQVRKIWAGASSGWRDEVAGSSPRARDGANSNLKAFEVVSTRPITRLGVRSIADARMILEHVTA
jgi:hypothetical protein